MIGNMSYSFEISYPTSNGNLEAKQQQVLQDYPMCSYSMKNTSGPYHRTIYRTDRPQEIAKLASALKRADSKFYIGFITHNNNTIYYHPTELALLSPAQQKNYRQELEHLESGDRVLHDYLVNLYHNVPL